MLTTRGKRLEMETTITSTRIWLLYVSANTPPLLFLLQQSIMRMNTLESSASLLISRLLLISVTIQNIIATIAILAI